MAAPALPAWQRQLLTSIQAPVTPQNLLFVNDWARAEGGGASNNPFNTTQPGFGATGNYNSVGVKNYATPGQGLAATEATLENGRYGAILGALRSGTSAKAAAAALAASPWGTGALVLKMLGGGRTAPTGDTGLTPPPSDQTLTRAAAPAATPAAPPPNFQPRLAAALAGARQSPTNDLTGFYSTLRQALQARDRAVLPSPQQVHQAGVVSGGRLADAANPSVIARRGQVGGNTKGENPGFLNSLAELAAFEHAPVEINSGYRSTAKQAQLYANRASNPNPVAPPGHSLHEQGLAADGTVGGKPLGTLPPALLARYGLMPVPGDPVHVEILRR